MSSKKQIHLGMRRGASAPPLISLKFTGEAMDKALLNDGYIRMREDLNHQCAADALKNKAFLYYKRDWHMSLTGTGVSNEVQALVSRARCLNARGPPEGPARDVKVRKKRIAGTSSTLHQYRSCRVCAGNASVGILGNIQWLTRLGRKMPSDPLSFMQRRLMSWTGNVVITTNPDTKEELCAPAGVGTLTRITQTEVRRVKGPDGKLVGRNEGWLFDPTPEDYHYSGVVHTYTDEELFNYHASVSTMSVHDAMCTKWALQLRRLQLARRRTSPASASASASESASTSTTDAVDRGWGGYPRSTLTLPSKLFEKADSAASDAESATVSAEEEAEEEAGDYKDIVLSARDAQKEYATKLHECIVEKDTADIADYAIMCKMALLECVLGGSTNYQVSPMSWTADKSIPPPVGGPPSGTVEEALGGNDDRSNMGFCTTSNVFSGHFVNTSMPVDDQEVSMQKVNHYGKFHEEIALEAALASKSCPNFAHRRRSHDPKRRGFETRPVPDGLGELTRWAAVHRIKASHVSYDVVPPAAPVTMHSAPRASVFRGSFRKGLQVGPGTIYTQHGSLEEAAVGEAPKRILHGFGFFEHGAMRFGTMVLPPRKDRPASMAHSVFDREGVAFQGYFSNVVSAHAAKEAAANSAAAGSDYFALNNKAAAESAAKKDAAKAVAEKVRLGLDVGREDYDEKTRVPWLKPQFIDGAAGNSIPTLFGRVREMAANGQRREVYAGQVGVLYPYGVGAYFDHDTKVQFRGVIKKEYDAWGGGAWMDGGETANKKPEKAGASTAPDAAEKAKAKKSTAPLRGPIYTPVFAGVLSRMPSDPNAMIRDDEVLALTDKDLPKSVRDLQKLYFSGTPFPPNDGTTKRSGASGARSGGELKTECVSRAAFDYDAFMDMYRTITAVWFAVSTQTDWKFPHDLAVEGSGTRADIVVMQRDARALVRSHVVKLTKLRKHLRGLSRGQSIGADRLITSALRILSESTEQGDVFDPLSERDRRRVQLEWRVQGGDAPAGSRAAAVTNDADKMWSRLTYLKGVRGTPWTAVVATVAALQDLGARKFIRFTRIDNFITDISDTLA